MARSGYRTRAIRAQASSVPLALGYVRVSSEDQAIEGVSLPAQHAAVLKYIAAHGWVLHEVFQDVLTGKRDDRPQYQAMLAKVRQLRAQGHNVVVVVPWLHRLGRRLLERVRSREELKSLGVATHSVHEGGEVSDLTANILAAVAQEEIEQLGQRVRATLAGVRERGWYQVTPNLPWGFLSRAATAEERAAGSPQSVLVLDLLAAPRVIEVFARAAAGESIRSIARWTENLPVAVRGVRFNDDAERATRRRKVVRDQARIGSVRMVQGVLRNPVYAGRFERDGERCGRWPALIDDEVWFVVQRRLDDHLAAPRAERRSFLLTGFLKCQKCGGSMHGETYTWTNARGERQRALRYRCTGSRGRSNECTQSSDTPAIDALVLAEVSRLLEALDHADPAALKAEVARLQPPPAGQAHGQEIKRLEGQAAIHRRRIAESARLLVDGALDRAGYEALVGEEQVALASVSSELERVQRLSVVPAGAEVDLDALLKVDWQQVVNEVGAAEPLRDYIGLLVASITPIRVKRGTYKVAIEWTKLAQRVREALGPATATRRLSCAVGWGIRYPLLHGKQRLPGLTSRANRSTCSGVIANS